MGREGLGNTMSANSGPNFMLGQSQAYFHNALSPGERPRISKEELLTLHWWFPYNAGSQ